MIRSSRKILPALLAIAVALVVAGCGDDKDGNGGNASADCEDVAQPSPKNVGKLKAPTKGLDSGKTYTATVETSCGDFTITLDPKDAPKTGASFVALSEDGFYDGLSFHRVSPGFVIQGGDPQGDGSGGPGYTVREKPDKDLVYSQGTVAMAKTADEPAGSSGSQFFVVTSDSSLPPEYALLGKVTEGIDVVKAIEQQAAPGTDGPPTKPVVIDKITINES